MDHLYASLVHSHAIDYYAAGSTITVSESAPTIGTHNAYIRLVVYIITKI